MDLLEIMEEWNWTQKKSWRMSFARWNDLCLFKPCWLKTVLEGGNKYLWFKHNKLSFTINRCMSAHVKLKPFVTFFAYSQTPVKHVVHVYLCDCPYSTKCNPLGVRNFPYEMKKTKNKTHPWMREMHGSRHENLFPHHWRIKPWTFEWSSSARLQKVSKIFGFSLIIPS